jgi:hypothetical protein
MKHDLTGVRTVDIHAHLFPQGYLDVLAEEGPRFNVEYRAADEGFYIKTEVCFQGPLPYRLVDIEKRIADMDAQGTMAQAMSLTGRWRIGATKKSPTNCRAPGTTVPVPPICNILRGSSDS